MSDLMAPVGASSIDWNGHVGMVHQADRRFVEFFRGQRHNAAASAQAGRPIYDTIDMVKIIHPGERDVHILPAHDGHKAEFHRQWAAYQAGQSAEVAAGTPIDTLYPSDPALVKQFQAMHIFTAEQLAGLTEQGISRLGMGGRAHVERAKKYLEHAERMSGSSALQRELDEEKAKNAVLHENMARMQEQLQALAARVNQGHEDILPRRGRRPRAHDELDPEGNE